MPMWRDCDQPTGYCPVHRFWPTVAQFTKAGDYIFPRYRRSNINRILNAVFSKIQIVEARRFTSKCSRRGRSNAMKDPDSTPGQIARAECWNADGYRSYLILRKDEGEFIASLIRSLDIDSPDESERFG